jgi:hypothetical protein
MTHTPAPDLFDVLKARQNVPLVRYEVRAAFSDIRIPCYSKADARRTVSVRREFSDIPRMWFVYDAWAEKEIRV